MSLDNWLSKEEIATARPKEPQKGPAKEPQKSPLAEASIRTPAKAEAFTLKLEAGVREDENPFKSFFVTRILKNIKAKHPDFGWEFSRDPQGAITEISFQKAPPMDREEIERTLRWSVKRTLEHRK